MLLGKRPRPPMKRTTSLSEITLDLNTSTDDVVDQGSNNNNPFNYCHQRPVDNIIVGGFNINNNNNNNNNYNYNNNNGVVVVVDQIQNRGVLGTVSARIQRRHSGDFLETPEFLRACFLCKRRLVPGRDIYMYRGDSAFCSLECRQQQMNQDERKDKFFVASKKQVVAPPSSNGSQPTTKGETVSASS